MHDPRLHDLPSWHGRRELQERHRPRAGGQRRERLMLFGSWGLSVWAHHSPTGTMVSAGQGPISLVVSGQPEMCLVNLELVPQMTSLLRETLWF